MFRLLIPTTAVAALILLAPGRAPAEPKYHHLHHAIFEMREAHKELKGASHNFGGHREQALKDLDVAIQQTEKALAAAGDPYKGWTPAKGIYDKYKNHPHLRHSLVKMREAHKQMKEAGPKFGGHREKALHDLDAAIHQVEKCIEFAK